MLCEVVKRINIVDGIDYLSNIDFHYIILSAGINSFLQLLAEMVACRYYSVNGNIIASLLVGLFNGLLCFLQHHCKIESMHLINSATNYLLCKYNICMEMIVRINLLMWCFVAFDNTNHIYSE